MSEYVTVHVGPKNRLVLPTALRQAAGVGVGSELLGHVDPMGRLILETVDSVRARVWAAAPSPVGNSMDDVRAARAADLEIEAAAASRRDSAPRDDRVGERLLAELGL
jgi:hypothetical protein